MRCFFVGKASRSYVLTIPADVDSDGYSQDEVQERLKNYTYVGQLEAGEEVNEITGKHYLHWQVYIENSIAPKRTRHIKAYAYRTAK